MNVPPVTLPFLAEVTPKSWTGMVDDKNGRETGPRTNVPPVPSALYTSAFEARDGTKGGTFSNASIFASNSSFIRNHHIEGSHSVRRLRTHSPQCSDSQSVRTD